MGDAEVRSSSERRIRNGVDGPEAGVGLFPRPNPVLECVVENVHWAVRLRCPEPMVIDGQDVVVVVQIVVVV